jgi:hypothetical protein
MYRVLEHDLGESAYGRRKQMVVFVDTEEGSFCDCCRRTVRARMVTMSGCDGEYGGPEVCENCIATKLAELVACLPPPTSDSSSGVDEAATGISDIDLSGE